MAIITAGRKLFLSKSARNYEAPTIGLAPIPENFESDQSKVVEIVYRDVPVEVIKEIERIIEVKVPVYIDKPITIEKIVEVVKEVPVYHEVIVNKEINVESEKLVKFIPKWVWSVIALESLAILGLIILK